MPNVPEFEFVQKLSLPQYVDFLFHVTNTGDVLRGPVGQRSEDYHAAAEVFIPGAASIEEGYSYCIREDGNLWRIRRVTMPTGAGGAGEAAAAQDQEAEDLRIANAWIARYQPVAMEVNRRILEKYGSLHDLPPDHILDAEVAELVDELNPGGVHGDRSD